MTKPIILLILCITLVACLTGCDALQAIAPLPQATAAPTLTAAIHTLTPSPTLGNLQYINAAYCLDEDPDVENEDDEHNILRFFPSGIVLELKVQGQGDCLASWDYIAPYLLESATDIYNHGEYQLSGSQIQFALAPAGSDQIAGIVSGKYEEDKLLLQQQGVAMEYVLVYGGE